MATSQMSLEGKDHDALVKKMKVLSKAQSAFLKVNFTVFQYALFFFVIFLEIQKYLHDKLTEGIQVIEGGLDTLSHSGSSDPRITQSRKAIEALNLDQIKVDVTSSEVMLRQEIALLQASVDKGLAKVVGSESSRVKALEEENQSLRELLKSAKAEITRNQGGVVPVVPPPPPSSAPSEDLSPRLRDLESKLAIREADIQALQAENSKLIAATSAADVTKALEEKITKLEAEIMKARKDADTALAAKIQELTAAADKRVADIESKLESEKDEMMDAMAQEVEVFTNLRILFSLFGRACIS